jgi:aryl-alcohol dehydrogenase-like predicted oxidoreductase
MKTFQILQDIPKIVLKQQIISRFAEKIFCLLAEMSFSFVNQQQATMATIIGATNLDQLQTSIL